VNLKRTLKRALAPDYSEILVRLRAAILKGELAENHSLEDNWDLISRVTRGAFGDSLDQVELMMALEEHKIAIATVGEFVNFLELLQRQNERELSQ
jgi:hypothetical protein